MISAPAAAIAFSVASDAQVATPVASVAPAAAPGNAQATSLPQSTMLSEHSAQLQDLQRQLQLQNKDFQRQLQLQNTDFQRQLLQIRQQLQDREDVISQLQHQFIQVQEEVQGNSRGQLHLEHAVRTCQRQQGQQRAQPSTSRPLRHTTQTLTQPATQTPAQPLPSVQPSAQPQPSVQPSAQPSPQNRVQRAAQPPRPQSELTALIPSWARLQQPVQLPPIGIDEAPGSTMVLPEEQERRKRSANVVMYGLLGESSTCLKQAAEEVFQALNLPRAGQHVVAVEPLPTQGPYPPVVVRFDDPYWSTRLLRSKRGLRRLPALARVYIAEHLTRNQQAEKATRQPRFDAARQLGRAFWRGSDVMLHRREAAPGSAPEVFAC